ncbi:MAG TPA: hypothetical protein VF482_11365 [Trebonia sp.]
MTVAASQIIDVGQALTAEAMVASGMERGVHDSGERPPRLLRIAMP